MTTTRKTISKKQATKANAAAAGEAPPRPQAPAASRTAAPEAAARPGAPDVRDAIARRAYEIYEAAGRPDGQAEAHWLLAEAEILTRAGRRV